MGQSMLIQARGVVKSYAKGAETVRVLHGIDLDVDDGEWVALMGPSGSGKTTLLNLLGGLDVPDEGSIQVAGEELVGQGNVDLAAWRARHVGFIFQLYNLLPVLTAFQNVELPLLLTPLSRRERREHVEVALSTVGLSDRMDHAPSQLSGGQQQRVAIARALVHEPRLLVCDEPTAALDSQAGRRVMGMLRDVALSSERAVVIVTHDDRIFHFAHAIARMEDGRVLAVERRAPTAA